uniref:U13-Liphistoxin-Lm1a_1 n=1 Tax=Liphistius malayanus TaxID=1203467 RepID=A0A482ZDB8_9ARAC
MRCLVFFVVFLTCYMMASNVLGEGKKIRCWLNSQCNDCNTSAKYNNLTLCCSDCEVGLITFKVQSGKARCWCTLSMA